MKTEPVIARQEFIEGEGIVRVYRSSGCRVVRSPLDDEDRDPSIPTVEDLVDMEGGDG